MTTTARSEANTIRCNVCGASSVDFGSTRVLNRFDVRYFQCTDCRFVQTEQPYWLDEAYATALIAADVGAVERNVRLSAITQTVIQQFFDADAKHLDYGGGYGLFVRLMRDRGFNFRWSDRYASNLLSIGFEAGPNETGFDVVTAFEVLEHVVDPITEMGEILQRGNALLCTTELLPDTNPRPGEWWYYVPSGGQHISLYTLASLERVAHRFECHFVSDGRSLHLFSKQPISEKIFRLVTRRRLSGALNRFKRRESLVHADFERATGHQLP